MRWPASTYTITLRPEQRQQLLALFQNTAVSVRRRTWAWIIVRRADSIPIAQIAREVGIARANVYKRLCTWRKTGLRGLLTQSEQGRPRGTAVLRGWHA